jgi:RHS repeat-associated protein
MQGNNGAGNPRPTGSTPAGPPASPLNNWALTAEAVDPVTARRIIESRPMPKVIDLQPAVKPEMVAGDASNTVEGPASIVELARALGTSSEAPVPQKMFKWVYDNVEFVPTFGMQKGAYGTLVDGFGNAFDQSALLIALLRQAGFTANYVQGTLQLTLAQCQAWFGSAISSVYTASGLCSDGGIPNTVVGTFPNLELQMSHCWVQVNVGTVTSPDWVVMDPSFKTYTTSSGINLATAMGYTQSTFISDAESGTTIDSSGNWVENINTANIATQLKSYADSLISYIRTNNPTATLDQVLGGSQIVQQTVPFTYLTSLPYEMPGDTPTIWTGDVPTTYKITVQIDGSLVGWNASGSPLTFTSDQIYAQRFTVFYNSSNEPILTLNGAVQATGTAQSYGSWASLTFTVTHNAYPTTFANQTFYQQINAITSATSGTTYNYLIGTNFGAAGKGLIDSHQAIYAANAYSGTQLSEPVLGEMLMVLWATYAAELHKIGDLLGRMTTCVGVNHHMIGMTCYESSSSWNVGFFDIQGTASGVTQIGSTSYAVMGIAWGMHGYALEQLAIQQVTGVKAASATRILDTANTAGTKIYKGTQANWSGTVEPALSGYNSTDLSNIYTYYLSYGYDVWLPQTATQTMDSVTGYGWALVSSSGAAFGIIETLKGGSGTQPTPPWDPTVPPPNPNGPPFGDPVDYQLGAFQYNHNDMSIGSFQFPYQLYFQRIYNSGQRYVLGSLGYGWKHNWDITAIAGSDAFEGYGIHSPISAAATIAEMYVFLDVLNTNLTALPVDIVMVLSECNTWWIAQQTKNVVNVTLSTGGYTYALLPDGTYKAPLNCPNSLTLAAGAYTVTTPQQVKMNFNTSGQLATWAFPYGVTVTLNYSSGLLQSITNGLTRTLTLSYTENLVTGISDGTGRSVAYAFDANNQLTGFTDALSNKTTFAYNLPGQMISYFLPQNPNNALLTNTFDTLGRVSSQADAYGNIRGFYLANSRSEFVDPNLNSQIAYFDPNGNVVKQIDQLGYISLSTFDGLGRLSTFTWPEGNSIEWVYDNTNSYNNLLRKTLIPKPGSPLSNILLNYTSDATYNKIHTFEDGNSNTWTYNYDPSTGNLLSAVGPQVVGQTPQKTYTYNSRGQMQTYTDETSILTQYNYDGTTEKLLSVIVDYGVSPHLNLTTSYGYDSVGNINSVTDSNTNQTMFTSDASRRLTQKTDPTPFGYITNFSYDKNNNGVSLQRQTGSVAGAPAWQVFSFNYTLTNKLATVTNPASSSAIRTFDNFDRLWTSTDAQNRKTTFAYDVRGNLYTVTDPTETISQTRLYSSNNYMSSIEDSNTNVTHYTRDGFDRQSTITYADTSYEENYSYDNNNNLLTYYTRSGNSITYTWDALNRLSTKSPQAEATATYQYDLHGRKLSSSTPVISGNPATGTFNFYYDSAGRFYKESTPSSLTTIFGLDSNGNVTKITYPDGYYVTRSFDQVNRLSNIYLNGSSTAAVTIAYDQLSRRQSVTFVNGVVISYAFQLNNDLAELDETFVGSGVTFAYSYNNVHQETARSATDSTYIWHPPAGGTTSYGTATDVNKYPSVGGASYSYDGNANLESNGTWTYTFDTENHLTAASATGTSVSYVYDADHRQIQKTVGSTENLYVYSLWQRIADYNGSTDTLETRYVYGDNLDEPLIAVSSSGTLTYLHADKSGSIIATTNSSGAVTNKNSYSLFGESSGGVNGTTFGFTGQRYDADTGLYYYKRRYYSSAIGRFLQPDPIRYTNTLNLYTYAYNDPGTYTDKLGLLPGPIAGLTPPTAGELPGPPLLPGGFLAPPGWNLPPNNLKQPTDGPLPPGSGTDTNNPPGDGTGTTIAPPYGTLPPGSGTNTNNPPGDGTGTIAPPYGPLPPGSGTNTNNPPGDGTGTIAPPYGPLPPGSGPDTNNPPGGGTIAPPYGPLPPGAGPDTNNPPSDGNLVPLPPGAGSDNGKP